MIPTSIVIALGSNLGDRAWHLRRALYELGRVISIVRLSSIYETEPVDAPPPRFLNMVVVGHTWIPPRLLLCVLLDIEERLGRRRSIRNAPRIIDLDLIFHGAHRMRTPALTLPHPRYHEREFVLAPLRELGLPFGVVSG